MQWKTKQFGYYATEQQASQSQLNIMKAQVEYVWPLVLQLAAVELKWLMPMSKCLGGGGT